MDITFEEIVERIETISLSHRQVNNFGYGDPWEVNKKDYKYPLVYLTDGISSNKGGSLILNFKLMVMDKTLGNEENELPVLSNCLLIGNDILGKLDAYSYTVESFKVDLDNIELRPFTNSFSDDDAGWQFTFDIVIGNAFNSCDAPFTS